MLEKIPKISQMKLDQRRKSMSKVTQNNIISEEYFKTISVWVNVKIWKNMNKMKSIPSRNKQCIENTAGRSLKNETKMMWACIQRDELRS